MMEQAIAAFVQEARDIVSELEAQLLSLEGNPEREQIDAIFRGLHTIKGSGSMFGYTALARFTHHFENTYELVRSGKMVVDRSLIDLSLAALDQMTVFLDLEGDGAAAEALLESEAVKPLILRLQYIEKEAELATPKQLRSKDDQFYRISFRPEENSLRNGMRPDLLVKELGELGEIAVEIDASELPALGALDPELAYLTWHVTLATQSPRAAIEDVFLFAEDSGLTITEADEPPVVEPPKRAIDADNKDEKGSVPQDPTRNIKWRDQVRVAPARLDEMMDSIGELVIAQTRLDAVSERLTDSTLSAMVEEVGRLVLGLRDVTLSIRMMPIEAVFGKFRRVVRDLSGTLGKEVELVTLGGETEVDKTVIDKMGDPLVHMIRNALDHGLETTEERVEAGKPAQGKIHLVARQEGGEILISLQDDGRGLNSEAIRRRAVDRGLIPSDAELPEQELHMLIFEPGFSTAQAISAVSGRGVGMDAVKTAVEALSGSIDLLSVSGKGTCVTLRLPVTLAIIDGLRVRLGNHIYVIPLSSVEECVEIQVDQAARQSGRSVLQIRDELVPFLTLDTLFGQPSSTAQTRRVVIVRVDGKRVGLAVDDILGQGQTVIKSLSPYHSHIPGLGGATILGDGQVALIIDVATLIRWAENGMGDGKREVA